MENCSDTLPFTKDYYDTMQDAKRYFLYVDVVLTALVLVLFCEEVHFVIRTYKHRDIAVKSIWLISIYPVFAVSSLLAVCVPRAVYICDFVSAVYLSCCLFQFTSLLLLYFGGPENLLLKIQDSGFSLRTRPCCCCCLCCPVLPPTRRSLVGVRLLVFQTVVLMPIIQFVGAVLWADHQYSPSGIDPADSYIYLTVLKVASTVLAIYGVNALHEPTQLHLRTFSTRPKRAALILVQVFFNIQGAVLGFIGREDVLDCRNGYNGYFQMLQWQHLVLVVEMFLLSVLARLLYRRPLQLDATLEERPGEVPAIYTTDQPNDHFITDTEITAKTSPPNDQPNDHFITDTETTAKTSPPNDQFNFVVNSKVRLKGLDGERETEMLERSSSGYSTPKRGIDNPGLDVDLSVTPVVDSDKGTGYGSLNEVKALGNTDSEKIQGVRDKGVSESAVSGEREGQVERKDLTSSPLDNTRL